MKILVVEDEASLSNVYQKVLTRGGYDVSVAKDGEAGLQALRKETPDMIITDLIMPMMNGFDMLQKIRTLGLKLPIIVMSNLEQPDDRETASNLGALEYIVKSNISMRVLLQKVDSILRKTAAA